MSPLLIVAATTQEIQPLLNKLGQGEVLNSKIILYELGKTSVCILITGVGMCATAFELGKAFSLYKFKGAINLGVAGAFSKEFKKGELVEVTEDCFGDLGAEDGDEFLTLPELNLQDASQLPFQNNKLLNIHPLKNSITEKLKKAKGISVNKVHGAEGSIEKIIKKFNPEIESMEGAAFFYACFSEGIPCLQIRAISNYVEKRNRDDWELGLAVKNLNEVGLKLLKEGF